MAGPLQRDGDDLLLAVHAQPGASRSEFAGLHGEAVKVRIQAPPVDGRANLALQRFLADAFAVPAARVILVSGPGARQKRWRICRPQRMPEALAGLLPA